MPSPNEAHSLRSAIDRDALLAIKDTFERLEPLATGALDDYLSPRALRFELEDGIGDATSATLTVRWTVTADYNAHYSDDQCDLRWDVHPHDYPAPPTDAHHHPPPDGSAAPDDVVASCIAVTPPRRVARAVHVLWRRAYDRGTVDGINGVENPP